MPIELRNFVHRDRPGILAVAAAADAADGCERGMSAEEFTQWLAEEEIAPHRDIFVALDDGKIVGYLILFPKGSTYGAVHPGWRRRGIGGQLMEAAERRAGQRAGGAPASISVFFRSTQTDLKRLCQQRDMHLGRCLCRLLCDLRTDLPTVAIPRGFAIRAYGRGDDAPLLAALNEVFDDDPMTEEQWAQIGIGLPQFWPELWFLGWAGNNLAGFVLNRVDPAWIDYAGRQEGELDEVGVRKAYRGQGLASALIAHSLRALREAGMDYAHLNVNLVNLNALSLYQRLGFVEQRRNLSYRKSLQ